MTLNEMILAELARLYPNAGPQLNFSNPYETLVATMLSAQCTDKQVNKVTPALFAAYPGVDEMAAAEPDEIYPYVKSCGFKSKSVNIVMACRKVRDDYSSAVPDTMEGLTSLPGVGRKTANVVLAFAFGQDAIPVDTHVFRVANRLGLAEAKDPEHTERQLQAVIPKHDWSQAHHWLIYHGRQVCHAQHPDCEHCTLRSMCRGANRA